MTTIYNYRTMLRVNKHRLDDELEIQSELQERIGQEVTRKAAQAAEAKEELARVEARLGDGLRDSEKLSLDAIKAKVVRHQERRDAWDKLQRLTVDHAEWRNLYDAWLVRGFSLRDLGGLFANQYFAVTSTGFDGTRRAADPEPSQPARRGASDDRAAEPAARTQRRRAAE